MVALGTHRLGDGTASRSHRTRGSWRTTWHSTGAYLLLLPSLVGLSLFTYWPIARLVSDSLYAKTPRSSAYTFTGIGNYAAVLGDPAFHRALINTALYSVGTIGPSLLIALGVALALGRSTRLTALLRAAFFLPVLIPLVAAASLFLFIFLPGVGLLDHHIGRYFTRVPNWLGDPDIALASIIVLTIWKNVGYYMLFLLAGLQAVPHDAYEAAYLDGATPWQRLRLVTLPYLQPTLAFVAVIAALNVVTQVDHVFVLTKGGPSDSTNLLLFYIYQQAVENYDVGKASAATLISLAFLLVIARSSLTTMERAYGGSPS